MIGLSDKFYLDKNHDHSSSTLESSCLVHRVEDEDVNLFFWDHAENISQMHGIPLHNLVLGTSLRKILALRGSDSY